MDWNSATASLLVTGTVFAALQLWWIRSLVRRNRRRRGAEPLSQQDFRQELERIFRKTT
ncbi:putative conserved membrane protein [Synechococcus sp. A18-46.1]|nr:putative conserved membrane protein [Synechococcus sp. A18-46.1]